jgi:hypothetical protein
MDRDQAEELLDEFLGGYEDIDGRTVNELLEMLPDRIEAGEQVNFENGPVWTLTVDGDRYVLEKGDDGFVSAQSAESWLDSALDDASMYVTYDNQLETFWDPEGRPPPLFHATDEDNVEEILAEGLEARDETRGTANRGTGAAVFTSFNPDAIAIYGDTILKIDTVAMRRDGFHPELDVEAGIRDYEEMTAIRYAIGLDEDDYVIDMPDSSEDYDTVVVFSSIPAKYISVWEG